LNRILLDCDGVLADFVAPVIAWAGGDPYTRDSITDFDILKAWGIEHRQSDLDAMCAVPGFCESLAVIPGAQAAVERLRRNFEVVIVTSPYSNVPTWTSERITWLNRHFGIDKRDVVFCKRKELVRGDALVDDAIHNLELFPGMRILVDHPWNRTGPAINALRCVDLNEVCQRCEEAFM
jgi:5'(3')-deoxyribonucleotidase